MRNRGMGQTQQPMTPAQAAAWYAALPWYVKPFASVTGAINSGYCFVNSSDPICATNLYTPSVATATAPGLPVNYNPATGTVDPSNTAGDTTVIPYGPAISDALPPPPSASDPAACLASIATGDFSCIPGWLWALVAVIGIGFAAIELPKMPSRSKH
jgi:hypothetical protein